jgi:hypothetical protein
MTDPHLTGENTQHDIHIEDEVALATEIFEAGLAHDYFQQELREHKQFDYVEALNLIEQLRQTLERVQEKLDND